MIKYNLEKQKLYKKLLSLNTHRLKYCIPNINSSAANENSPPKFTIFQNCVIWGNAATTRLYNTIVPCYQQIPPCNGKKLHKWSAVYSKIISFLLSVNRRALKMCCLLFQWHHLKNPQNLMNSIVYLYFGLPPDHLFYLFVIDWLIA